MTTKLFRSDIKAGTPSRIVGNDVNGKLNEIVYHLNSDNSWATANDAENLRLVTQYSIKQYVASQISTSGSVTEWVDSVLIVESQSSITSNYNGFWSDFISAYEAEQSGGDPYPTGSRICANGTFSDDATKNYGIIEWTGSVWKFIPKPSPGTSFLNDIDEDESTFNLWVFDGVSWVKKSFGITYTGGNGITISDTEVSIKIETSNSGLTLSANGLKLKANTSNFKIDDANGLGLKDGTANGQVWYWNGSNWVADTIINLFASKYKTNVGFSGTMNGTNKTFVVDNGAGTIIESTLTVYKNGMRMDKTVDYTYVNATKTLTFTSETNAPESDAVMVCDLCEV
jgi:hypothetical protein